MKLRRKSTERAEDGEGKNLTGTGHMKRKDHVRAIATLKGS